MMLRRDYINRTIVCIISRECKKEHIIQVAVVMYSWLSRFSACFYAIFVHVNLPIFVNRNLRHQIDLQNVGPNGKGVRSDCEELQQ